MKPNARSVVAVGALLFLLGGLGLWLGRGDGTRLLRPDDGAFVPGAFAQCELYRWWVMAAEPGFAPLADDFPGLPRVETSPRLWASIVFTDAANPYSESLRRRRARPALRNGSAIGDCLPFLRRSPAKLRLIGEEGTVRHAATTV